MVLVEDCSVQCGGVSESEGRVGGSFLMGFVRELVVFVAAVVVLVRFLTCYTINEFFKLEGGKDKTLVHLTYQIFNNIDKEQFTVIGRQTSNAWKQHQNNNINLTGTF